MATQVNLDALIPREDFEVIPSGVPAQIKQSLQLSELEKDAFFYGALRKPDFQRETAEWSPKQVVGLIRTFVDSDLIPAVILWPNKEMVFVIDGSHRLCALIAWVQDDYGDGKKSQLFFHHMIPEEQLRIARRTRELVEKEFGTYQSHKDAIANPEAYGPDVVARARKFGVLSLQLQWVQGDANKAEDSFIRINQQAVTITPQELELLRSRRKPNTIAARAIIRRGTGHQYWSLFTKELQNEIREVATELYTLIFDPSLRYPIKSLDLPAGGTVYSPPSLRMVYDFIKLCVDTPSPEDDKQGTRTIEYLRRTRRVMRMLLSNDPSSIGLHPAVYFYSWTGKQQPILFLTMTSLLIDLERSKHLPQFITYRAAFETFLTSNRSLLNQVIRKFGTKVSGVKHLRTFYEDVLRLIGEGTPAEDIAKALVSMQSYSYLQPAESPYDGVAPTKFSTQVKSGLVIRELLMKAPRCPICGGVVPAQAISVDHIRRVEDGGESMPANAQLTHPYCNSGIKESLVAKSQLDTK